MSISSFYGHGGDTIFDSTSVSTPVTGDAYKITPSRSDDVVADRFEMCFVIDHTITGSSTPTTDVTLQMSVDGTSWFDAAAFTQLTSSTLTKVEPKVPAIQAAYVRVKKTTSGTIATYTSKVKIIANGAFRITKV